MKRREEADAATQIRRANRLLAQYRSIIDEV